MEVMKMAGTKEAALPMYKGKPLVRSGNVIYYGNPADPFIAMLQVLSNKSFEDLELSDKVSVQILSTDETLHTSQRVIKRTEKAFYISFKKSGRHFRLYIKRNGRRKYRN